jgi:hypothetical protein
MRLYSAHQIAEHDLEVPALGATSVAIFSVSTSFNSADDDYSVTGRMRLNCGLFRLG